jgi:hypothetical protein
MEFGLLQKMEKGFWISVSTRVLNQINFQIQTKFKPSSKNKNLKILKQNDFET